MSDTKNNFKIAWPSLYRVEKSLDSKDLGNSKEAEKKKVVNEKVENKKIENEKVEIEKQEVQMDKKDEKKEEDKSTPGKVQFPDKPSQLSYLSCFHKDLERPSWMNSLQSS